MRGEDNCVTVDKIISDGSPPHARGRPLTLPAYRAKRGITPACAGKTLVAPGMADWKADHPRMRGEDEL